MITTIIKIAIIAIYTITLNSCINLANNNKQQTLRILSYNIHHGAGLDKQLDLQRIANVIKSASPDLVSLQEVDVKTTRSKLVDQAQKLAQLTNMQFAFSSSMNFAGGKYGNAILTKFTIKNKQTIPLPGEPRSALFTTITIPINNSENKDILFISTHLDTKPKPRYKSIPIIIKQYKQYKQMPAIIAGDFNCTTKDATMKALEKNWTNTSPTSKQFTFPANNPNRQIDFILVTPQKNWQIIKTKTIPEKIASDHQPILTILKLQTK